MVVFAMNSVLDFLHDHKISDTVLVLGQCPSTRNPRVREEIKKSGKIPTHGTYARLERWMDHVGLKEWDFHNVIPNKINSYDIKEVDEKKLKKAVKNKKIIIALGGFVERVCKKYSISNYKIDHPSPRNRNLNSKEYEQNMLNELKDYLNNHAALI